MIAVTCRHCQSKLKAPEGLAGRNVRCPRCKNVVGIPQLPTDDTTLPPHPGAPVSEDVTAALTSTPSTEQDESLATVGHLRIQTEIARGGMGAIMRAVDEDIQREVAVKFLLKADERAKARFFEEAQITGQLEHPNIVPIHQLGVHSDGRCFFSMKMVKGRSLAEILKAEDNAYSLSKLLAVFVSICNAMAFAHSRKVIHRDLKPANVMVGDFGEVYVMDWGLAKSMSEPERQAMETPNPAAHSVGIASGEFIASPTLELGQKSRVTTSRAALGDLTQTGAIMGTPAYMPPEQATGSAVDERADVYSLGAILYEIMTLTPPPNRGGDMMALLMRVVDGKIDPPEKRSPQRARVGWIPPELSAVATKALAHHREDRYPTVETLKRDVELFLEGRSVSAKQDSTWEIAKKFVKRNKGLSAGLALALLVLLGSLVFILSAWRETSVAYSKYEREQQEKEKRTKDAIPAFIKAVRHAIQQKDFDDALAQTRVALDYDPDNPDLLLLHGQQLAGRKDFHGAVSVLNRYLAKRPDDVLATKLAKLCAGPDTEDTALQQAIGNTLAAQKQLPLAFGLFQTNEKRLELYRQQIASGWGNGPAKELRFDANHQLIFHDWHQFQDLTPLKGIPLSSLVIHGPKSHDLDPLDGMPLTTLRLAHFPFLKDLGPIRNSPLTKLELDNIPFLENLGPLQGLPLTHLIIKECPKVKDLQPLSNMRLHTLIVTKANGSVLLEDLSPLRGAPLQHLDISHTKVQNINALRGMPIKVLNLTATRVDDLEPLQGMELEEIVIPVNPQKLKGMKFLRAMPTLRVINKMEVEVFWPKFDAGEIKK